MVISSGIISDQSPIPSSAVNRSMECLADISWSPAFKQLLGCQRRWMNHALLAGSVKLTPDIADFKEAFIGDAKELVHNP